MINEKNASYYYVANVVNGIADEASYEGMAAGSLAVVRCTDNLNEETALSGTPTVRVRIVQKKADGTYVFSPTFTYADIVAKSKLAYAAPAEQISYWGYDGTVNTTGLGTIVTGGTYTLHFVLNHTRNTYNNAPQIKTVPFKAQSTSQGDLALGLQLQFLRTFSLQRDPTATILCERTANGTYTNATGWTFVNGSTIVTKTTHGLTPAAGTALRLATADPSSTATAPAYRVVSYAANTITLDAPYQGAASAAGHVSYATVAPTAWGLKFTGIAQPAIEPTYDSTVNQKVYFDVNSEDFGAITEYKATAMSAGSGSSDQVSYKEVYSQFLDKDTITSKRPRTKYRTETIAGNTYNLMNLTILASDIQWQMAGISNKSYINITLAFKSSLTYDNFETVFTV